MAGYEVLGPSPAADTSHKAVLHGLCRDDGRILTWPVGGKELLEDKLGGANFTQNADVFDTLRFTKTKDPPCTTTFLDGCGVTHTVTVMPDDEVKVLIPLPDETFTRHVNTYKQIVWMFDDDGGMPTKEERSCAPAGSTLAECTFTYEPGSTFHNHGIRIRVQAYSRSIGSSITMATERLANSSEQEKAFWEADVLREPAPFLHKYCKLLELHAIDMVTWEMVELEENPTGAHCRAHAKVRSEKERKRKEFNDQAIPLMRKSFAHHDKRGNNVLDQAEAATFFSHVVDKQVSFISTMMEIASHNAVHDQIELMMQEPAKSMAIKNLMRDTAKPAVGMQNVEVQKVEEQLVAELDKVKAMTKSIASEYTKTKAAKDAAAFKVLDTNCDGTLQLDEVIAAMTLGSARNTEFIKALGFVPVFAPDHEGSIIKRMTV